LQVFGCKALPIRLGLWDTAWDETPGLRRSGVAAARPARRRAMARVRDVLSRKARSLHTVESGASVLEAARVMNDHKIGSVVVVHGGRMVGILTERDILTRVVARQSDPSLTRVADVMTRRVLT